MGIQQLAPTPVHGDNTASLSLLASGVTKRSRHFDIEWFKVKDLVEAGELVVSWVPTEDNLADFFTKKLARERFQLLRDKLMGDTKKQNYFGRNDNPKEIVCSMVTAPVVEMADLPQIMGIGTDEWAAVQPEAKQTHLQVMEAVSSKFGMYACLTPWLPVEVVQWHGPWLVRNLAPNVTAAVAQRLKPGENMVIKDWISWGVQGGVVTAIRQCLHANSNFKPISECKGEPDNGGKLLALVLIQPPCNPTQEQMQWRIREAGGTAYLWHPFAWCIPFDPPIAPYHKDYEWMGGGFMCLHNYDIKHILRSLVVAIHAAPAVRLGGKGEAALNLLGKPPSLGAITALYEKLHTEGGVVAEKLAEPSSWEQYFPARIELLKEIGDTASPIRLSRKPGGSKKGTATIWPDSASGRGKIILGLIN